jgi:hypothetical protein
MKDESRLITESTIYDVFRDKGELKIDYNLPSYLYPFILSVIGDKRRNIGKIKGVGINTIYKNLSKLFKTLDIGEDEYVSFEQLAMAIKEDKDHPSGNREKVVNNYLCIDIDRQYAMVSESQKTSIENQMVNHYSTDSLKSINSKYFESSPISLMELNNYTKRRKNLF